MKPIEFKIKWNPDSFNRWWDFDPKEIDKLPVLDKTKDWLKEGIPEDAAPFLCFGLRSYNNEFHSISEYYSKDDFYDLSSDTSNYWIIGSDGGGNPICIDSGNNDAILLLDHEDNFNIIVKINDNISELACCLWEYKNFIKTVNADLGKNTFSESKFTTKHLETLKQNFKAIKSTIFETSGFWNIEIRNL